MSMNIERGNIDALLRSEQRYASGGSPRGM